MGQSRRAFLRNAAAWLPGAALAGHGAGARSGEELRAIPLGVQLFTVRRQAEQNLPDVLDAIRHIGYDEVETYAGLYIYSAAALRHMVVDAGLRVPSGHFDYSGLASRLNYASALGLQWVVCAMLAGWLQNSLAGFHTAAQQFNTWGKQAKELGMRFAYHNHGFEFRPFQGKTGYDVLIEETDPELVFFEMDCYWAAQAGHDPVALMQRLGPRVKMLHLKDRAPGFPPSFDMGDDASHFVPVGRGTLDWRAILAEGERLGVEHYFVEQDETVGNPVAAIRTSYRYLRSLTQAAG